MNLLIDYKDDDGTAHVLTIEGDGDLWKGALEKRLEKDGPNAIVTMFGCLDDGPAQVYVVSVGRLGAMRTEEG